MRMHARSTALKLLAPVMLSLPPAPLLAAPTKAPSKASAPTSAPAPAVPLEPRVSLNQVDDLFRGNSSHGKLSIVPAPGDRTLPPQVRMQPKAKPNEYTEPRYQLLEFDAPLEDSFFSKRNSQRR